MHGFKKLNRREKVLSSILFVLSLMITVLVASFGIDYPTVFSEYIPIYQSYININLYNVFILVILGMSFLITLLSYIYERKFRMMLVKIDGERFEFLHLYEDEKMAELEAKALWKLGYAVRVIYSQMLKKYLLLKECRWF